MSAVSYDSLPRSLLHSERAHKAPWLSWRDAQKEAQSWVDRLQLPKETRGKFIDLTEQAKALRYEVKFRAMVIRAARRILRARGIECNLPED